MKTKTFQSLSVAIITLLWLSAINAQSVQPDHPEWEKALSESGSPMMQLSLRLL